MFELDGEVVDLLLEFGPSHPLLLQTGRLLAQLLQRARQPVPLVGGLAHLDSREGNL